MTIREKEAHLLKIYLLGKWWWCLINVIEKVVLQIMRLLHEDCFLLDTKIYYKNITGGLTNPLVWRAAFFLILNNLMVYLASILSRLQWRNDNWLSRITRGNNLSFHIVCVRPQVMKQLCIDSTTAFLKAQAPKSSVSCVAHTPSR